MKGDFRITADYGAVKMSTEKPTVARITLLANQKRTKQHKNEKSNPKYGIKRLRYEYGLSGISPVLRGYTYIKITI